MHDPRTQEYRADEGFAIELDGRDPLREYRSKFHIPRLDDGRHAVYFTGNSLGLQPIDTAAAVREELDAWARLGVEGHFEGAHPWFRYHEPFGAPLARLVGAHPDEVVVMNGLTVNLHLLLASFFRPQGRRRKVLMEACAFPSDNYAIRSQLHFHGLDPQTDLLLAGSDSADGPIAHSAFEALLERHGDEIALVLVGGVQYYTGQVFDIGRLSAAAHAAGCVIGVDLAHAAGNIELALHDDEVDFAVWCSYKYLNAGPGAVAGAFVHRRHLRRGDLPRFAGWWGNDPETRFRMHLEREFVPVPTADAWQLSNPPVLALAPLRPALALFEQAGLPALREKSKRLTGYLEWWIDRTGASRFRQLTPRDPRRRGCQLSLLALERPRELFAALQAAGVVCDYREPDVIRVAPVPLYNSFHDVWRFGRVLESWSTRPGDRR